MGCSPRGRQESDMTERLPFHFQSCSLVYLDPRSDRDYESMKGLQASKRTGRWTGRRQVLRALAMLSSLRVKGQCRISTDSSV